VRFSSANFLSGLGRGLALLGIALWGGGMTFFGAVAAPLMFRAAHKSSAPELAPILAGQMLDRFTWVTYACALALLLGWWLDGFFARDHRLLWWLQGALSALCLGFALYLGAVLLPQTVAQQDQIVPLFAKDARGEILTPAEHALRARFDVGHKSYEKLGALNVYLLLGLLAIIVARTRVWASGPQSLKMKGQDQLLPSETSVERV